MTAARTPQQERSQRRRDALLHAAVELIAEGGVNTVTHRAVAARAGLPPSTTGYFFASIDNLAAEALREYAERQIREYRERAAAAADTDGLIEAVANLTFDAPGELAQITTYLEASRNPAMREPVGAVLDAYRQLAEDVLAAVGLPDAAAASSAFVALLDGFTLQHLARPDAPPNVNVVIAAMRALLAGYLLDDDERRAVQQRLRVGGLRSTRER